MNRRRGKRNRSHPPQHVASQSPDQFRKLYIQGAVGMICIKTIRAANGNVIIEQGERIREELITALREEELVGEILANAMPGKNHV